jgi:methyltransferase (TIGR00027 family)
VTRVQPDRPSSTARLIARCTLLAASDARLRPLVPAGAIAPIESLLTEIGGGSWFEFARRHAWTRALLLAGERLVLPGIIAHYLARKRWLEARVSTALSAGFEQIVVLGAGFDTLACRLHSAHPTVRFFELDHPATQRPKAAALSTAPNLAFLPADLARVLPSSVLLADPRFDSRRRTFVVAEGLLMYFPEIRVREILADLTRLPAAQVAFTFMAPGDDGRAAFRGGSPAIGAWLRFRREPFAWALAPAGLAAFLRPLGLHPLATAAAAELRAEVLVPAGLATIPLAEGEHLCLASNTP